MVPAFLAEVVDVSKYQGDVDYNKVKAAGIYGVVIRAGYGREESQKDPYFDRNYAAAAAAGLHVGAYWYSYAIDEDDARREADVFARVIEGKTFDLPVYLDLEEHTMQTGSEAACAIAFLDVLAARRPDNFVGFYSYTAYMNGVDLAAIRQHCDTVWKADYRANPDTSIQCDMHQYTSKGKVDGIAGNVDCSRLYRDFSAGKKKQEVTGMNTMKAGPASSGDIYLIGRYCDSIGAKNYEKAEDTITVRDLNDTGVKLVSEFIDSLGNIPYTVVTNTDDVSAKLAEIDAKIDSILKMLHNVGEALA